MAWSWQNWLKRVFYRASEGSGRRQRSQRACSRTPRRRSAPLRLEALESRDLPAGTWTALANTAPAGVGTMLLLSDGTIMAQGPGVTTTWYRLTPDASGSYVDGTWSTLASMHLARLYFTSDVLPNGEVFVYGGEYSGAQGKENDANSGEIYNPATNTWTTIASIPTNLDPSNKFGDDPSEVLANGNILTGYILGAQTFIYNPSANTWSAGPTKLNNDRSDEETWVKLPDGSILSYDVFDGGNAQRYVPSLNEWVAASTTGDAPPQLQTSSGSELGPALLLPDGQVFFIGATSNTAIYTPPTTATGIGTWTLGPTIPGGLGANDAPGAMMPNGDVLFNVGDTSTNFNPPTTTYEYNPNVPVGSSLTNVTISGGVLNNVSAYTTRMLMLPSGQVLFTDGANQLYVYTPSGAPSAAWEPTISGIANISTSTGVATFTLTGTQLAGLSKGSGFGDDAEMASNYPIIQFQDQTGKVAFARTVNWNSTGVATGTTPETVNFTMPAGTSPGAYLLSVIANGIASPNVLNVQMGPGEDNILLRLDPANSANVQILNSGSVVEEYPEGAFNSIIVDGNPADSTNDQLAVDFENGSPIPSGGISYGGGGDSGNSLTLEGQKPSGSFTNEIYASSGPQSGSITLDGSSITYTQVQALTSDSVPAANLVFDATSNGEQINVINSPSPVNGLQATQINNGGSSTFLGLNFANKASVTVNGMGGTDTITLNNPAPAAGLGTLTVDGGSAGSTFNVQATASGVATLVNGGAGANTFTVGSGGSVKTIVSALTVNGGGQQSDSLTLDDSGDAATTAVTITATQVGAAAGDTFFGPGGSLTYSGLGTLTLFTGSSAGNTVSVLGSYSPGPASGSPGVLNINASSSGLSFAAGSTYVAALDGATAGTGYDQINVAGTVDLSNSPLLTVTRTFAPTVGQSFLILQNDGPDAIVGAFSGLASGSLVNVSGLAFQISYTGGDGNDVALTRVLAPTTTSLAASTNPSVFGPSLIFTATVTGFATPTGTVTFLDGSTSLGTGTLDGAGRATFSGTTLGVGSHVVTALYAGDGNSSASTSSTISQMVNQAATGTSLTASAPTTAFANSVSFTATVTGTGPAPTGPVTFDDGATSVGTGTLSAGGVATFSTSSLAQGGHTISTMYGGDSNYSGSGSNSLTQTVTEPIPSTSLVSSAATSAFTASVSFTVTLTSTAGTATGMVTFDDGATALGTGTLNAGAVATFSTSSLSRGSHTISAVYGGDSNFLGSTSNSLTQTVIRATTTTALIATATTTAFRSGVTFTATVTSSGTLATGTITFEDGATPLGSGALNATGVGTYSTTTLSVTASPHTISAVYGGDSNFTGSTSSSVTQAVVKNVSGTALTSSAGTTAFNTGVTFTATVTSSGTLATGTITFEDGATPLGSGTLNSAGVATFLTTALSVTASPHTISAVYGGDSNFSASPAAASLTQVVNKNGSSTALTSSAATTAFNTAVTFTATVTSSGTLASGTVTFEDGGALLGIGVIAAGKATFSTASLSATASPHTISAVYNGDSNFSASPAAASLTQVVNKNGSSAVLTSSAATTAFNTAVTFTATVTSSGTLASGTVTFEDGGALLGIGVIAAGKATFSTTTLSVTASPHTISAIYGGDSNFSASPAASLTQVVSKNVSSAVLTSSALTTAFNTAVTFTAIVTSSGTLASGTVTFEDGGALLGIGVIAAGKATFSTTTLSVTASPHTISAIYGGDSNFSASPAASLTQVVNKNVSSAALTSSAPTTAFSTGVIFTATVTSSGTLATGTITFEDGATPLGSGTLNSAGVATFLTTALSATASPHTISAVYSGDSNFSAAPVSNSLTQVVSRIFSSTALTSSAPTTALNTGVTFTAIVTSSGTLATGTITFEDGATPLGSGTLNATGVGTFSTTTLSVTASPHSISAVYGGDSNFSGSVSRSLTQVVTQSNTSAGLSSSMATTAFATSVTFTARVASSGTLASGTVTFDDGATAIGSGLLSAGLATFATTTLSVTASPHAISAVYGGDSNFSGSTSNSLTQVVIRGAAGTSLTTSAAPISFESSVTFTATLSSSATPATGVVTFEEGLTSLGTGVLSGGVATFSTNALSPGTHLISAAYAGDSNFNASTSNTVTEVVNALPLQVTGITGTATGFTLAFNEPISTSQLFLYSGNPSLTGQSDVFLTDALGNPVRGSLLISTTGDVSTITYLLTGQTGALPNLPYDQGTLPSGTYTVVLQSGGSGFSDTSGDPLNDGSNYTTTFSVAQPGVELSLPDFARGPGQLVNLASDVNVGNNPPANDAGTGIPIRFYNPSSTPEAISTLTFQIPYNPSLLTITGFAPGADAGGATISLDTSTTGLALVGFTASPGSIPTAAGGGLNLIDLFASVPTGAPYDATELLDLQNISLNGSATPVGDDNAIQTVTYLGDTDNDALNGPARSSTYTGPDATNILNVTVGQVSGFSGTPLVDPFIIGDILGAGSIGGQDATEVLEASVGQNVAELPAIPGGGFKPALPAGPDPMLSIPRLSATPGATVLVPVELDQGDGLNSMQLALSYDTSRLQLVSNTNAQADVLPGSLTQGFTFHINVDPKAGTILLNAASAAALSDAGSGSVAVLVFQVKANAPAGAAFVNLEAPTALQGAGAQGQVNLPLSPAPGTAAGSADNGQVNVVVVGRSQSPFFHNRSWHRQDLEAWQEIIDAILDRPHAQGANQS